MIKKKQIKSFGTVLAFGILAVIFLPSLLSQSNEAAEAPTASVSAEPAPIEVPVEIAPVTPTEEIPPPTANVITVGEYDDNGSYDRDLFGSAWADVDGNGCDTRNDVLTRDIANAVITSDCNVQSGTATDPYTGLSVEFVRGQGTSNLVPIDHIIALGDAYYASGYAWSPEKRAEFANDPLNLISTTQTFNSWKSDKTPSEMLDAEYQLEKHNLSFTGKCFYASEYTKIAVKYELPVRQVDANALNSMLTTCA